MLIGEKVKRILFLIDILHHKFSDGPQTKGGDAEENGGRGGEVGDRAVETFWGINGAQTETGASGHEGHDGQRVRPCSINAVLLNLKCLHILAWNNIFFLLRCTAELKKALDVRKSWRKNTATEWRCGRVRLVGMMLMWNNKPVGCLSACGNW